MFSRRLGKQVIKVRSKDGMVTLTLEIDTAQFNPIIGPNEPSVEEQITHIQDGYLQPILELVANYLVPALGVGVPMTWYLLHHLEESLSQTHQFALAIFTRLQKKGGGIRQEFELIVEIERARLALEEMKSRVRKTVKEHMWQGVLENCKTGKMATD